MLKSLRRRLHLGYRSPASSHKKYTEATVRHSGGTDASHGVFLINKINKFNKCTENKNSITKLPECICLPHTSLISISSPKGEDVVEAAAGQTSNGTTGSKNLWLFHTLLI
jgi:hypothetical protein